MIMIMDVCFGWCLQCVTGLDWEGVLGPFIGAIVIVIVVVVVVALARNPVVVLLASTRCEC